MHSSQYPRTSQYPQAHFYPQAVPYSSAPQPQGSMPYSPNSQPPQQGGAMPAGAPNMGYGYYQQPHSGGFNGDNYSFGGGDKKRSKGRLAAIITVISLVLGCTGVAIAGIMKTGSPFGLFMPSDASTAEGAFLNTAASIDADNWKNLIRYISPAEMKYVTHAAGNLSSESDDALTPLKEMANLVDVSLKDLEYDHFELNDNMVAFQIHGGELSTDVQDEDAFIDAACDGLVAGAEVLKSMSIYPYTYSLNHEFCVEELREEPEIYEEIHGSFSRDRYLSVVSVKENGRWYISPMLSALIAYYFERNHYFEFNLDSGDFPHVDNIEAERYSSAQDALQGVTQALEEGDISKLLGSLPEAERRIVAVSAAYEGYSRKELLERGLDLGYLKIDFGDITFHEEPAPYGSSLVLEELYVDSYEVDNLIGSLSLDNGNLDVKDGEYVCSLDVSDGESSLLALGSVKDREGWHLSAGHTYIDFFVGKDVFSPMRDSRWQDRNCRYE